jgi:hypothetical protein
MAVTRVEREGVAEASSMMSLGGSAKLDGTTAYAEERDHV